MWNAMFHQRHWNDVFDALISYRRVLHHLRFLLANVLHFSERIDLPLEAVEDVVVGRVHGGVGNFVLLSCFTNLSIKNYTWNCVQHYKEMGIKLRSLSKLQGSFDDITYIRSQKFKRSMFNVHRSGFLLPFNLLFVNVIQIGWMKSSHDQLRNSSRWIRLISKPYKILWHQGLCKNVRVLETWNAQMLCLRFVAKFSYIIRYIRTRLAVQI